jgi:hypothetical protein
MEINFEEYMSVGLHEKHAVATWILGIVFVELAGLRMHTDF